MAARKSSRHSQERLSGLVLIICTLTALVAANSPFEAAFHDLVHLKVGFSLPRLGEVTVHALIADGLMAIFFLLVGLEVKREWYEGRLATPTARRLPILAAIAGMAVPAAVYVAGSGFDRNLLGGWAIPAATDIAFVIGLLALLGPHAPAALRLLLVTIAIVDDIGAVAIIALAYTDSLDGVALGAAAILTMLMAAMSLFGVRRLSPYMLGFAVLWFLVLASGVHATIAGIIAALTIPLASGEHHSPLKHLEHAIHPWVLFGIIPLFGLVSAGVHLGEGFGALLKPLPLAVMLGLVVGKQLGIFGAVFLAVKTGYCRKPNGVSWPQIYGGALFCGVGFTMSLFIGALAFPGQQLLIDEAKIGTLAGSIISALLGWLVLRLSSPIAFLEEDRDEYEKVFARQHRHRDSASTR